MLNECANGIIDLQLDFSFIGFNVNPISLALQGFLSERLRPLQILVVKLHWIATARIVLRFNLQRIIDDHDARDFGEELDDIYLLNFTKIVNALLEDLPLVVIVQTDHHDRIEKLVFHELLVGGREHLQVIVVGQVELDLDEVGLIFERDSMNDETFLILLLREKSAISLKNLFLEGSFKSHDQYLNVHFAKILFLQ